MLVGRTDDGALDGQGLMGDSQLTAADQNGDEMELFHMLIFL